MARQSGIERRGEIAISDEKPPELLKVENKRLRERITELEEEVRQTKDDGGGVDRRLTQLIRKKNLEIEESNEELKIKAAEAQATAEELAFKNEELTNSMAALRLYQLMFENEPNALIGVSAEGQIIQFNSSAIRYFGYDLHKMRMQSIADLKMPGTKVNLKAVFDETMEKGESAPVDCKQQGRSVRVNCFRLEDIRGQRGAFFRIADLQE